MGVFYDLTRKFDYLRITLSGSANKGKKVRVVSIPDFVRNELVRNDLLSRAPHYNIFSRTVKPLNECYFSLQWSRIRPSLVEKVGITDDHTLYSIRATAAVEVYKKTKDPYKLQRLMGHSSLQVTLTYLRSLGLSYEDGVEDLPSL
jgi:integrase